MQSQRPQRSCRRGWPSDIATMEECHPPLGRCEPAASHQNHHRKNSIERAFFVRNFSLFVILQNSHPKIKVKVITDCITFLGALKKISGLSSKKFSAPFCFQDLYKTQNGAHKKGKIEEYGIHPSREQKAHHTIGSITTPRV